MKLFNNIIDEIWEENKGSFSSRKEVYDIVYAYTKWIKSYTSKHEETVLPGIGYCTRTRAGTYVLRANMNKERLTHNKKTLKYMTKRRRKWLDKYIDDAFPKNNLK